MIDDSFGSSVVVLDRHTNIKVMKMKILFFKSNIDDVGQQKSKSIVDIYDPKILLKKRQTIE